MFTSTPEVSSAQGFLDVWIAVGPVVGAMVGGAITWVVQRSTFRYQQKRAKEDASYQERKIAYVALLRTMRARNRVMADILDLFHARNLVQAESEKGADLDAFDAAFDEMSARYSAATAELLDALSTVLIVGSNSLVRTVIDLSGTDDLFITMPEDINDEELSAQSDAANYALIRLTAAMRKDLGHAAFAEERDSATASDPAA